jgi:protein SCO1/2
MFTALAFLTGLPPLYGMRKRFLFVFIVAAVGGIATGFLSVLLSNQFVGYGPAIEIPGERELADFTLIDQFGRPFTLSSVKGKAVLIYFGYTHCPDVCPLVLSKFKQVMERLGPDADRVVFIFITVDPERDTPEVMRKYISYYTDRIVGLSGSPDEVNDVLNLYGVFTQKYYKEGVGYLMDHTAWVLGADKSHVLRTAFTYEMSVDDYVKGVRWLLSK